MLDALPMTLHLDPMEPQKRAEIERERESTHQTRTTASRGSEGEQGQHLQQGSAFAPTSKQQASKQERRRPV